MVFFESDNNLNVIKSIYQVSKFYISRTYDIFHLRPLTHLIGQPILVEYAQQFWHAFVF